MGGRMQWPESTKGHVPFKKSTITIGIKFAQFMEGWSKGVYKGGVLRAVPALCPRCAQSLSRTMPNLHSSA